MRLMPYPYVLWMQACMRAIHVVHARIHQASHQASHASSVASIKGSCADTHWLFVYMYVYVYVSCTDEELAGTGTNLMVLVGEKTYVRAQFDASTKAAVFDMPAYDPKTMGSDPLAVMSWFHPRGEGGEGIAMGVGFRYFGTEETPVSGFAINPNKSNKGGAATGTSTRALEHSSTLAPPVTTVCCHHHYFDHHSLVAPQWVHPQWVRGNMSRDPILDKTPSLTRPHP